MLCQKSYVYPEWSGRDTGEEKGVGIDGARGHGVLVGRVGKVCWGNMRRRMDVRSQSVEGMGAKRLEDG